MKAVIFDYGGTLDTNGVHWSEKFRDVFTSLGIIIPDIEFSLSYSYAVKEMDRFVDKTYSLYQTVHKQIFLQLSYLQENQLLTFDNLEKSANDAAQICHQDVLKTIKTFTPLLESLCKKYLLGLVSNYHGNLSGICKELELDRYFKVMIDSSIVNIYKPDPRIFKLAIEQVNVTPEETWVIGDSYDRDIEPAKSLGCRTIWLKGRSWKMVEENGMADFVVGSLEEVGNILIVEPKFVNREKHI